MRAGCYTFLHPIHRTDIILGTELGVTSPALTPFTHLYDKTSNGYEGTGHGQQCALLS